MDEKSGMGTNAGMGIGSVVQRAENLGQGVGALTLLRTLFDYSFWAREKLLEALAGVGEEQLRDASSEGGVYGSIHSTMAHLAASEWLWVQRCMGESPMRSPTGDDFATLHALIDWWNGVHADAVTYLSTISEADLDTELTYMAPDGKRRTRKIWHMLLQVPNHQTEHRSQIATILGSMGIQVPQTDMVVYFSEKAQA